MLVLSAFKFTEALFDSEYRKVMKPSNISHRNWPNQCTEYFQYFKLLYKSGAITPPIFDSLMKPLAFTDINWFMQMFKNHQNEVFFVYFESYVCYVFFNTLLSIHTCSKSCNHTWCHVLLTHCYFFLNCYFKLGTELNKF